MLSVNLQLASMADGFLESGNGSSLNPVVSTNGRYVAFVSTATDLVSGMQMTPGLWNVYRYDRLTDETELISVNWAQNGGGNGSSGSPAISADGSVIAFTSRANNLDPDYTYTGDEIYVRNVLSGITTLVSVNQYGTGGGIGASRDPVVSADGNVVAFESRSNLLNSLDEDTDWDVYARNLEANTTFLVSINAAGTASGDLTSWDPVISGNGTVVAFSSSATNLDPRDTNSLDDVFARNLVTQKTYLVSINNAGAASGNGEAGGQSISDDGTRIAFVSNSTNLDTLDTGREYDVFIRDLSSDATHLVSVNTAGTGGANGEDIADVKLSADGNMVAFSSNADNLHPADTDTDADIFARDLSTGVTYLVSQTTEGIGGGAVIGTGLQVSADGNVVVFHSPTLNLSLLDSDHEDFDVFTRNIPTATTELISVNVVGTANGNGQSYYPAISADGSVVAFYSYASDLVAFDSNSQADVFVATLSANVPQLPGDYNRDGTVDAADYVTWRKTQGIDVPNYSGADGNGNGIVDMADLEVWQSHFSEMILSASGLPMATQATVGVLDANGFPSPPTSANFEETPVTPGPFKSSVSPVDAQTAVERRSFDLRADLSKNRRAEFVTLHHTEPANNEHQCIQSQYRNTLISCLSQQPNPSLSEVATYAGKPDLITTRGDHHPELGTTCIANHNRLAISNLQLATISFVSFSPPW